MLTNRWRSMMTRRQRRTLVFLNSWIGSKNALRTNNNFLSLLREILTPFYIPEHSARGRLREICDKVCRDFVKPPRTDDRSGLSLALTLRGRYDWRNAIRVRVSLRREHVRFKVNRPFRSCSPANDCSPSFTARSDKPRESFSSSRKSCHVSDAFVAWAYIYRLL